MKRVVVVVAAAGLLAAMTSCGSGQGGGYSTPSTGVVTFTPSPTTPASSIPSPSEAPTGDPAPTTKATTAPLN